MLTKRAAEDRGYADHGWLKTWHTFSFAGYLDPDHMGFRTLRVINDDIIAPGKGFGTHPHQNMEVVTYPLEGALEHRDSTGTGSVLRPGDVQRMSAGRGITHSEFNHSPDEPLRLLQIWILPERENLAPGYEEATFTAEQKKGRLRLIVSPDGRDGSLKIHQDARIFASILGAGESVTHEMEPGRHLWLQVATGKMRVGALELSRGDGAAVSEEEAVTVTGRERAEFLLFDLA